MKRSIFLIIAALILTLSMFLFQSQSPKENAGSKEFTLLIADKKLVSGPNVLTINEGDSVHLVIRIDQPEEFHLHGYDKSIDLVPGTDNNLSFAANLTGRFTFELEQSKTELGALEVQPR